MDRNKNLKCLLVDDDKAFLFYLKYIFERNGFNVTVCSNAYDSLAKVNIESFDLIVSDIDMPIMNGFNLLSSLKEHKKAKNIPVICVSNLDDHSSIKRALDLGAVGYFKKPFLKQHLFKVLDILDGKNLGQVHLGSRY